MRFVPAVTCAVALGVAPAHATIERTRRFTFEYAVTVKAVPAGAAVDVYVPLAQDTARQTVKTTDLNANIDGLERTEAKYGNRYWHGHADSAEGGDITVALTHLVERRDQGVAQPTDAQRTLFLAANSRVPVDGPLVSAVRKDLGLAADATPMTKARAIYDYVVDNVEYKKTGTGWGNGDTEWACTKKYGNCTDFHALFTSIARAEDIPARFEIGFPVPVEPETGEVGGYHCWIEVALPEVGWFPIDASEAHKHPDQREALFGSQPLDRVRFTVGRDLVLEGQQAPPLNYFVYPHVEVAGETWSQVETRFGYRPSKD